MNLGLKVGLGIALIPFFILMALLAVFVVIYLFAHIAFGLVLFFLLSLPFDIPVDYIIAQLFIWGLLFGMMSVVAVFFWFAIHKSELQEK